MGWAFIWLIAIAFLAMLGLLLLLSGKQVHQRQGLADGPTVAMDSVTLKSRRYGLIGRPDRLIRQGGTIIPEEWKSSRTVRPWHLAQMGVYFLLIEEELGVIPPHGFIVCGNGTRHRIDNSEELRAWVLDLASGIRSARAAIAAPIPVQPKAGQCRPCGMRVYCVQARL
ncbi:Dna2/Cas4 domain-containing protein [Planctomyces sp. SH-PL62]|uniref:CRISPR-associated protein Cas4 n=1 Tax=Planctomyces sp. SH-PL62 TaxID=1636152 RepID=UPI00078D76AD|nr:Dna2/Cas4 domain-containing protein [Planctomyces sp. SH-PL62]AMV40235.1 PD-(D/E)XK nuclease superfamily protein [Planctomyces sp. SH-PL62]